METYIPRFATKHDLDKIMKFIKNHWKHDHILAQNKSFFIYEFMHRERVNFVIAENTQKNIVAIEGFIKYSEAYQNADAHVVMWKAIKGTGDPLLGVKLLNFITDSGFRSVSSCGINLQTVPIYQYLGYFTGSLDHYYQINSSINNFKIPIIKKYPASKKDLIERFDLIPLAHSNEFCQAFRGIEHFERKPYKDLWYLLRRYYQHPMYQYKVFGIIQNHHINSFLIGREVDFSNSKAFRIIDFIGHDEDIRGIAVSLENLMRNEDYEYIDFYQYGISDVIMRSAGFSLRTADDPNIIPNYFEPFAQTNVSIHFFTNSKEKIYIFKGDADQDRPNILQ